MVAFCGASAPDACKYDESLYRLISVTIHEVGHNWFDDPRQRRASLGVDERGDELVHAQYFRGRDWDPNYPSRRGPAKNIVDYFRDPNEGADDDRSRTWSLPSQRQTGVQQAGSDVGDAARAGAGTRSFDRAFLEYGRKWAFKKPQPADFFRTVVNGAGEHLNWFWRGMFYTTYANDRAVANDRVAEGRRTRRRQTKGEVSPRVTVQQRAGLIMPIHLEITYDDGSKQVVKLPADVWRNNEKEFTWGFFGKKDRTGGSRSR
ncbi:MAG: hypothetical protein IPJ56_09500 [Gemmatimonadetes bacterium]|nr:hypothetical protein [Gemmatimonadota bacterium]